MQIASSGKQGSKGDRVKPLFKYAQNSAFLVSSTDTLSVVSVPKSNTGILLKLSLFATNLAAIVARRSVAVDHRRRRRPPPSPSTTAVAVDQRRPASFSTCKHTTVKLSSGSFTLWD
ncbi:hypothetical protein GQ457_04G024290 [Hibiscus cannabinus]